MVSTFSYIHINLKNNILQFSLNYVYMYGPCTRLSDLSRGVFAFLQILQHIFNIFGVCRMMFYFVENDVRRGVSEKNNQ